MPDNVIAVCPSFPWTRALPFNSQDQTPQSYPQVSATLPKEALSTSVTDKGGLWPAGHDGNYAAERLMILPYCEGPAGSLFWMRLYGVSRAGNGTQQLWFHLLLAQFVCVAGDLSGPDTSAMAQGTLLALTQTENLCGFNGLINGGLGQHGRLVNPGRGFAAYTLVELLGHEYFRFEFQCPETQPVGMNAFWRRA